MAELADAAGLSPVGEIRGGSSPSRATKMSKNKRRRRDFEVTAKLRLADVQEPIAKFGQYTFFRQREDYWPRRMEYLRQVAHINSVLAAELAAYEEWYGK
jgi:hypothetical protein